MAEFDGEVLQSERLRDALFTWVPEAARLHCVRFSAHFWVDDDAETEFHISYDPDDSLLDLEVFERSMNGFLNKSVEIDADTGEINTYGAHLLDLDRKAKGLLPNTEEFLRFVGSVGLNLSTLTTDNEEYFLRILNSEQ